MVHQFDAWQQPIVVWVIKWLDVPWFWQETGKIQQKYPGKHGKTAVLSVFHLSWNKNWESQPPNPQSRTLQDMCAMVAAPSWFMPAGDVRFLGVRPIGWIQNVNYHPHPPHHYFLPQIILTSTIEFLESIFHIQIQRFDIFLQPWGNCSPGPSVSGLWHLLRLSSCCCAGATREGQIEEQLLPAWTPSERSERNDRKPLALPVRSDVLSLIGTVFLWMFLGCQKISNLRDQKFVRCCGRMKSSQETGSDVSQMYKSLRNPPVCSLRHETWLTYSCCTIDRLPNPHRSP